MKNTPDLEGNSSKGQCKCGATECNLQELESVMGRSLKLEKVKEGFLYYCFNVI